MGMVWVFIGKWRGRREGGGRSLDAHHGEGLGGGGFGGEFDEEAFAVFEHLGLGGGEAGGDFFGREIPHCAGGGIDDEQADEAAKDDVAEIPAGDLGLKLHAGGGVARVGKGEPVGLPLEETGAGFE